MRLLVCFVLIWTCSLGQALSILGLFPLPSSSHYGVFEPLMKALAKKGHDVDVFTFFPSKDVPPTYNQISLEGSLPIFVNNFSFGAFYELSHYGIVNFITHECGIHVCEATLKSPMLQSLKTTKKKYDLVITEIFGQDCMLAFGHFFQVPTIGLTSSIYLPWGNDRIGLPDNPSYIPTYFTPSTDKMNFYERIKNTILLLSSKFLYTFFTVSDSNRILEDCFGPGIPKVEDLILNISLVLVNSHFSMNYARPTLPNFIEVGGLHIREPKPLSEYFERIVTTNTNGVILLTMGSMLRTETFEPEKLQAMFDAFAQLPYKVLWKAVREDFPKGLIIPNNIHFENWVPQRDLLCHPNVKLFVSHGGLGGSQEAVDCGVPRLGIPIFADQKNNILSAEKMGLAIKLAYEDISKDTMVQALEKLLKDPKYQHNAQQAAKRFKDRPMTPLDTAIYWVEYVIRHNGAPHLRSAGADLPWYQYYLIDVGLILIFAFLAIMYITFYLLRLFFTLITGITKQKKD